MFIYERTVFENLCRIGALNETCSYCDLISPKTTKKFFAICHCGYQTTDRSKNNCFFCGYTLFWESETAAVADSILLRNYFKFEKKSAEFNQEKTFRILIKKAKTNMRLFNKTEQTVVGGGFYFKIIQVSDYNSDKPKYIVRKI